MNKYIALSLFILFALGCQEDSIIETSSEELSDPVIVESTLLEGKVTSISNEGLSDVVVDLFQSSEHIGQVITDGNGSYTSEGIAILPDIEVTLKFSKEEYILKQRRVNIQTTRVTSDVTLALEAEVNSRIDQEIIADAADTSLVRVFGYCLLQDGTPVPGVSCTALWEYDCFGTNTLFLSKAFRDISDQDGYFECYVEKGIEILFDAELWRFPIGVDSASQFFRTDCIEPFSLSEPVGPDCTGSRGFISLGNIIEDTEVEMRDYIVFEELGIGAMDFVPLTGSIEVAEDNEQLVFSNLSSFQFFTPIFRNISLGIGIDYEQIQSRFEGTDIVITEENVALDSAIIIAGAEPIYLPGERILTTTTTTEFNVTNRSHLWSLPISLQYDFLLSQQSTIQFGITSAFRFSTKLNGYFRDPDNLISKVENSPDIISYSGLSRMDISLRYARKFNGGLEFSCGLNYSNATNPLYSVANRSGILYDKEYEAIRFLLGIRYTLR